MPAAVDVLVVPVTGVASGLAQACRQFQQAVLTMEISRKSQHWSSMVTLLGQICRHRAVLMMPPGHSS